MIFEEPNTQSNDLESKPSRISRQLQWLEELVSNKMEYTPSLNLIVLGDPVKNKMSLESRRRTLPRSLRMQWKAPGAVREALTAAGITLRALVNSEAFERVFGDGV